MIKSLLLVALGGGVGAMLRHLSSLAALRLMGPNATWPWGTFFVNIAGALLMGLLVGWLTLRAGASADGGRDLRLLIGVGAIGGFTTFSAFTLETVMLIERREWLAAFAYVLLSVVLCVVALFAGLIAVRRLAG